MGHLQRFRLMLTKILVKDFGKQETLAKELQLLLKLDANIDFRPLICRYLSGDVENSRVFDSVHLVFWDRIIDRQYPLHYLKWLEQAYAAYDAENPSKNGKLGIRSLMAEPSAFWSKPDAKGSMPTEASIYPRFEAARQLMLGIAAAVERKALGASEERAKEGVGYLTEAIRLFRELPSGQHQLSTSDKFHLALALHMADWLLTEYADDDGRREKLEELSRLSALSAFDWVADQTDSWPLRYNVTETYGAMRRVQDGKLSLVKAIGLNPRLAAFDVQTVNDGLDEPMSAAPALQEILSAIRREKKEWLYIRQTAYKMHAEEYEENTVKGIKAMLKSVREMENTAKVKKASSLVGGICVAIIALHMSVLGSQYREAVPPASAKSIFTAASHRCTMAALKPIFGGVDA